MDRDTIFDVSLSFAGQDRQIVQEVARNLITLGFLVFYDRYFEVEMIGKDLITYLRSIYSERSRYCAIFISKSYSGNRWPNLVERQAILERATRADDDYLLPVALDDSWIDGLPKSICYLDAVNRSAAEIAEIISRKIGPPVFSGEEEDLFWELSSDPVLIGRFMLTFSVSSDIEYFKYTPDKLGPRIRQLSHFGDFISTYGLCKFDLYDSYDFSLKISLTEKGKRFANYIQRRFAKLAGPGKETNILKIG